MNKEYLENIVKKFYWKWKMKKPDKNKEALKKRMPAG